MSTRTRMTTIWCGLVATTTIALVAAQVGLSVQLRQQAQTLLAPSFTTAQVLCGRATYTENCASCHGGEPRRRGIRAGLFAARVSRLWFGRSADQPSPTRNHASGGAGRPLCAARTAEVLAYLMSQEPACRGRQAGVVESRRAERNVVAGSDGRAKAPASPAGWHFRLLPGRRIRSTV